MITPEQYIAYLLSTPAHHTCTNLAEHLDGVSHDEVSDFLRTKRFTARHLWRLVHGGIQDSSEACLSIDDRVQDKRSSHFIELVKRPYSGAVGGLVRGIGVVNLAHTSGRTGEFYPIDDRIYAPEQDGKTKHQHVPELLVRAVSDKGIQAKTVLVDRWYASVANLKLVHRLGLRFFTTLKANRMVSLTPETGYVHLEALTWSDEQAQYGVSVKLKEWPFRVRLFKVVAPNGHSDWAITTDPDAVVTTQVVQAQSDVRWQVHRGLKQLTGAERCQCRSARAQRPHLACCYHAWLSLKVFAQRTGQTLYHARQTLFAEYLRAELRHPHIPVFQGV